MGVAFRVFNTAFPEKEVRYTLPNKDSTFLESLDEVRMMGNTLTGFSGRQVFDIAMHNPETETWHLIIKPPFNRKEVGDALLFNDESTYDPHIRMYQETIPFTHVTMFLEYSM